MKRSYIFPVLLSIALASCDDVIHPTLQSVSPVYIVDAFVNDKLAPQVIKITYSQPYFEETLPPGVSGAAVVVTDDESNVFAFTENPNAKGEYRWIPTVSGFGKVGNRYTLSIKVNGENFVSQSKMGRVPAIDSITFKANDRNDGNTAFYRGQFWAADPPGPGDTYWIRTYKNGMLLNKPDDINLAYDAAFTKGANFDGFTFIQPIRNRINPNDKDANGKSLSPYSPGDSVYVEINSLTEASFNFLTQVVVQTNQP